jgi:hypothetical protein
MPDSPENTDPTPYEPLFREPKREGGFPTAIVAIAAGMIAVIVGLFLVLGRHHAASGESAGYAPNVKLDDIQMSQSESLSGGKSTYIDGKLTNAGQQTVTGVTVQVAFPTDNGAGGASPQTMTVPVQIIRSREPYVDVVPVSAAPVGPGASADFRLIFEGITEAWNQQQPSIQVTGVATR